MFGFFKLVSLANRQEPHAHNHVHEHFQHPAASKHHCSRDVCGIDWHPEPRRLGGISVLNMLASPADGVTLRLHANRLVHGYLRVAEPSTDLGQHAAEKLCQDHAHHIQTLRGCAGSPIPSALESSGGIPGRIIGVLGTAPRVGTGMFALV